MSGSASGKTSRVAAPLRGGVLVLFLALSIPAPAQRVAACPAGSYQDVNLYSRMRQAIKWQSRHAG